MELSDRSKDEPIRVQVVDPYENPSPGSSAADLVDGIDGFIAFIFIVIAIGMGIGIL